MYAMHISIRFNKLHCNSKICYHFNVQFRFTFLCEFSTTLILRAVVQSKQSLIS